jgi:hypothetical protein
VVLSAIDRRASRAFRLLSWHLSSRCSWRSALPHARPGALYAGERADAEEPREQRAAAVSRLARSYLAITHEADRLLRPYVLDDAGNRVNPGAVVTLADTSQARAWLTAERHNPLGCVRAMSSTAEPRTWRLYWLCTSATSALVRRSIPLRPRLDCLPAHR